MGVLLDRLAADSLVAGHVVRRASGDDRGLRHGLAIAAQLLAPRRTAPTRLTSLAQVDAWCQAGPVLSCVDDAHRLDNASIGLPRRLAWASRLTPSAVSGPCHVLPPVDPVDVGELVRERLGAWRSADPLRRSRPSRGDPLFVLLLWGTCRPGACSSGRVATGSPCRATRVPSRHLYASPRRVQSHVPHILAKLDLRSRMGIAAQCADVAPAWTEHRHDGGCLLGGGFLASLP